MTKMEGRPPKYSKLLPGGQWISYLALLWVAMNTVVFVGNKYLFHEDGMAIPLLFAPCFFFLYELMVILVVESQKKKVKPSMLVNIYMGLKVGRTLLSLLYVFICHKLVEGNMKRFVLLFVAIYLIYLLFDTLYLAKGEKVLKNE